MTVSGRHRLICLACTIVIWCIQASAQGYFLDRTDVTLDYVRTDADNGKFIWRHTVHVSDIKDCGSYIRYVTESAFSKENGKPLYRSSVFETTDVDSKTGDVKMDIGGAMASYIKARTGLNATSHTVWSGLAASVEPGDTLPSVKAQAKVGLLTYSVVINERIVLRCETITVPAGTFDCIVISEKKAESGPGHNRRVTNITWYAQGIGYVRHDTYQNGRLDTMEVLTSKTSYN